MMKKSFSFFAFLFFLTISLNANGQAKKVWLYKADGFYEKNDFASALRLYKMVLDDSLGLSSRVIPYEHQVSNQKLKVKSDDNDSVKTVSTEDYVHHQIAMCYRKSYDYQRSLEHFQSSASTGGYPEDYYYIASSLMNMGKYPEAMEAYSKFIGMEEASDVLLKRSLEDMSGCNYAIKLEADWQNKYTDFSDETILASMAQNEYMKESEFLASEIQTQLDYVLNIKNRGVKQAGFWVLHKVDMPNVLIELGFLTNKKDIRL